MSGRTFKLILFRGLLLGSVTFSDLSLMKEGH